MFDQIKNRITSYFINRMDDRTLNVLAEQRNGRGVSKDLNVEPEFPMAKDLRQWMYAVALATDPEEPSFGELYRLYQNLMLDNHLASLIDSRILYAQRTPFKIVDASGNENEDLSSLFERTWFDDLIRLILISRFQGRTLIELFDVNAQGELATVDEIPQTHFSVKRSIITKNEGDIQGWPYREGILDSYYIQVGKNYDLGILSQLAPAVLAKKLGMGAWQDYLDKYGVPPLFITTDRTDPNRLKTLYNAALNFKSNNFMVGQGNEKFEVGTTGGVSSADTYDLLVERINSEVSKRILGGSAITDEKAFVGSAEIQYKLAQDRFEIDKLLVKNVINSEVFPRLVKLSPVYAPLAKHYFEWDAKEAMSKMEIADLVVKLNAGFDVDPEWVEQQTGVPLLGIKKTTTSEEDEKKKPEPQRLSAHYFNAITAFYEEHHDCGHESIPEVNAVDVETWVKVMERIARDTYNGKIKPGELDPEHIQKTYDELSQGAAKGYGKNWNVVDENGNPSLEALEMKRNIFRFSGAKNAAMLKRINNLLTENGQVKPWNQFKNEVLKLNKSYNINYLQAEWQTAVEAGRKAQIWQDYETNKDLYPNLVYRTQEDDRVREEHDNLKGIVKPLDDPFWDAFYPPNGWRCFEPDTEILTTEGWKKIKEINRTDSVIGGSGNERFVGDVITNDFSGNLITLLSKRESLSCTPNHRFLTAKGWIMADDIESGDIIVQVSKTGFFNKITNAIHNTMILIQYGLMSFKRKRKSV